MRKNALTLVTAGLLLVALGLYWCSFTVSAGHVGVVKTLGAISAVRTEPGLYGKWPWPVQSVATLDVRRRMLTVLGNEVLTRDKLNVIVTVSVAWRVRGDEASVRGFANTLQGRVEQAEEKLASRVKAARKQTINRTALADIVSVEPAQRERFRAFEDGIRDAVQASLDEGGYGLAVESLSVQAIAFPKDVTERVFERMVKERERVRDKLIAEGETQAQIIRDNARTAAETRLAEAEAEAIRIEGRSNAEIADAYKALQANAPLANWLRKLETLQRVFSSRRSTLVLPNERPLDKLIEDAPKLEDLSDTGGQR